MDCRNGAHIDIEEGVALQKIKKKDPSVMCVWRNASRRDRSRGAAPSVAWRLLDSLSLPRLFFCMYHRTRGFSFFSSVYTHTHISIYLYLYIRGIHIYIYSILYFLKLGKKSLENSRWLVDVYIYRRSIGHRHIHAGEGVELKEQKVEMSWGARWGRKEITL